MPHRLAMLGLAVITAACQASTKAGTTVSPAFQLTVNLIELTQNPTPIGLPTSFAIDAPGLPPSGSQVDITWRALDGDPARAPRAGSGWLEVSSQGDRIVVRLTAPGRAASELLTLSGTMTGSSVGGTFSDRLYFARAGRFNGQMQDK